MHTAKEWRREWLGNDLRTTLAGTNVTCNTGLELLRSSTNLGTHPVSITSEMGGLFPGRGGGGGGGYEGNILMKGYSN